MSGVAAAIRFDGGPAPLDDLQALLGAASHRAPDGVGIWSGAGAALAKLHRLVLPGQQTASQPHIDRDSSLVVVFDGRLDARDLSANASGGIEDDAACVGGVLAARGDGAIEMLDGDFALLAWNPRTRRLIAARDRLGNRPLHWTFRGSTLLLASDVAQLLAAMRAVPAPDETTIADLLAFEPPRDGRTLYAGISRIPPGHLLVADERGVAIREYWRPEACAADDRRSDSDYAEECRALLGRAVTCRMRASPPLLVLFSGGIDSSSVLAAAVEAARDLDMPPPRPATIVFDEAESDERVYRRAFFDTRPLSPIEVPPGVVSGAEYRAQAVRRRTLPDLPSDFVSRPLFCRAQALGARVALTGAGGDFLFSGSTHEYADLLARGRVGAAIARYVRDRKMDDSGWSRGGLLTSGVWPLLPQRMRSTLRGPARRVMRIADAPAWVRLPRAPRPAVPDPPKGVSHSSWEICWTLRGGWTSAVIDGAERAASEAGVELRHPLWDPALIAFALRLPERQRRVDGTTKAVLRRAAALPDEIDRRPTKADFGHVVERALDALGGRRFFEALAIADAGWVDAESAARGYDLTRTRPAVGDIRSAALLPRLWMVAAVELWYRAVYP